MNALVVGLGRMGAFHAKVLTDLGLDVETVDPDQTKGATRTYIRRCGRFDVVCVATPIGQLASVALRAAAYARPDFILVEKPFAASIEEAEELAFALGDRRVAVGYVERFNPAVRAMRALATHYSVQKIHGAHFVRHNTRPSESVRLDLRTHDVDIANWLELAHCASYDTRDDSTTLERYSTLTYNLVHSPPATKPQTVKFDLTAHATSPLHAQWHALLSDRGGYATPADAITVLEDLSR